MPLRPNTYLLLPPKVYDRMTAQDLPLVISCNRGQDILALPDGRVIVAVELPDRTAVYVYEISNARNVQARFEGGPTDNGIRAQWPRLGMVQKAGVWKWTLGYHKGSNGCFVSEGETPVDLGAAQMDRGVACSNGGWVVVNLPSPNNTYSAQGIAFLSAGQWIGRDDARKLDKRVIVIDADDTSRYLVGEDTQGQDKALLFDRHLGRYYLAFDGTSYEPHITIAPDGTIWCCADGGGTLRVRSGRLGVEFPVFDTAPPSQTPLRVPAWQPQGTPVARILDTFFGLVQGEDANGNPTRRQTIEKRTDGYWKFVHRKGTDPKTASAVLVREVAGYAHHVAEFDSQPHRFSSTGPMSSFGIRFMSEGALVGDYARLSDAVLRRYQSGTFAPAKAELHPYAIHTAQWTNAPFDFYLDATRRERYTAEGLLAVGFVHSTGRTTVDLKLVDGVFYFDLATLKAAAPSDAYELNLFFDRVRPYGRPAEEGQSGLGGWGAVKGTGQPTPAETQAITLWVRPTAKVLPDLSPVPDLPLYPITATGEERIGPVDYSTAVAAGGAGWVDVRAWAPKPNREFRIACGSVTTTYRGLDAKTELSAVPFMVPSTPGTYPLVVTLLDLQGTVIDQTGQKRKVVVR